MSCAIETYGLAYAAFWLSGAAVIVTVVICAHREYMARFRSKIGDD